jgi:adenylylsulfate kinase
MKKDRTLAKKLIGDKYFIEIFCNSSLEICKTRDIKGLCKKAREGMITNFTGTNAPYEISSNPDLSINTSSLSIKESIDLIIQFLKKA